MNRGSFLVAVVVMSTMAAGASAQVLPPPPSWSLSPVDPDPSCGSTAFRFGLAQAAHAQLAVWNAEQTAVVRLLVDRDLPAGLFEVIWDGRDDSGVQVANGEYPYRLLARVAGADAFDASLVLQVHCTVATDEKTWGALKDLYRP